MNIPIKRITYIEKKEEEYILFRVVPDIYIITDLSRYYPYTEYKWYVDDPNYDKIDRIYNRLLKNPTDLLYNQQKYQQKLNGLTDRLNKSDKSNDLLKYFPLLVPIFVMLLFICLLRVPPIPQNMHKTTHYISTQPLKGKWNNIYKKIYPDPVNINEIIHDLQTNLLARENLYPGYRAAIVTEMKEYGHMHYNNSNYESAYKYYQIAVDFAKSPDPNILMIMADMHRDGLGIQQNYTQAGLFYWKSYLFLNSATSLYNLALLYSDELIPGDLIKSYEFVENGFPELDFTGPIINKYFMRKVLLDKAIKIDGKKSGLLLYQLAEWEIHEPSTIYYYDLAISRGHVDSIMELANIHYKNGKYANVAKYYKLGVSAGISEAMYRLGCMYNYGYGVEKDEKKAVELYKMAIEKNHGCAMMKLAAYIRSTDDAHNNTDKINKLYENGVKNGCSQLVYYTRSM